MHFNKNLFNGLLIFVFCTLFWISCSPEPKELPQNEYFDIILAELLTIENMNLPDSTKAAMIIEKLDEYDIEIQQIKKEISISEEDPEYWQKLYAKIKEHLKDEPVKY